MFHYRLLRRELPAERTAESAELLQGSGGAGQSHHPIARHTPFRFDRQSAYGWGDGCDSALAEDGGRSLLLAT
jgi:hypothetical protein